MQVNVDTNTLNKIEILRDSHRRAAMQDFDEWRSNSELPIFQDISGKVQENRKAYRYSIKKIEYTIPIKVLFIKD